MQASNDDQCEFDPLCNGEIKRKLANGFWVSIKHSLGQRVGKSAAKSVVIGQHSERKLRLCLKCQGWLVWSKLGPICPRPSCRANNRQLQGQFYVPVHVVVERPKDIELEPIASGCGVLIKRLSNSVPKNSSLLLARIEYLKANPQAKGTLDAQPSYTSPSDSTSSWSRKATRGA